MVTTGLIFLSIQVVLQKEIAFNDKPFLSIMSTIKQSSLSKSVLVCLHDGSIGTLEMCTPFSLLQGQKGYIVAVHIFTL